MAFRVSHILGSGVKDRDGRDLGRIIDLIFDSRVPGSLCYVLISISSPEALPKRRTVALPWSLVRTPAGPGDSWPGAVCVDLPRAALDRLRDNPLL